MVILTRKNKLGFATHQGLHLQLHLCHPLLYSVYFQLSLQCLTVPSAFTFKCSNITKSKACENICTKPLLNVDVSIFPSIVSHEKILILINSMVFICSLVYVLILKITIGSYPYPAENKSLAIILKLKTPLQCSS